MQYKGTAYPSGKEWEQMCGHSFPGCSCCDSQGGGLLLGRESAAKNAEKTEEGNTQKKR